MRRASSVILLFAVTLSCGTVPVVRQAGPDAPQQPHSAQMDSTLEARKHYSFAKQYEQNSMVEDAVTQYRKALRYDSRNPSIHYSLGRLYYRLRQSPLAKAELLRAVRLDSTHADAHYLLANIYYEDLETEAGYDSCVIEFEKTAVLRPDDVGVRRVLTELYLHKERYEDALRHSVVVTELAPQDVSAWIQWGGLAAKRKQTNQAIAAYTQAWGLDQNVETLKVLAALQHGAERYAEALESYQTLSSADPENYDFLAQTAEIHGKLGNMSQVIETLERMVALRPNDLKSISRAAEWYFNREELETAREWIDRGLEVNPGDGRMLVLSGDYYLKSGQEDLAIAEYERALNDPLWKANAQQRIWTVRPPLTEEEKRRREFFDRGKEKKE